MPSFSLVLVVDIDRTTNHAIGKFVEIHLRALRVLRGDYLPSSRAFAAKKVGSEKPDKLLTAVT
jgi:hypothetical protein